MGNDAIPMAGGPGSAVVVGAGVVGLSTAWFLQQRGIEVTVVDRADVAAGASWGNAGWLSPGLAVPLNEPSVLRYGLRTLLDPRAPLHVAASFDPALWRFLLSFAAHCTWDAWERAMRANLRLNADCLNAFDQLTSQGVEAPTASTPITAVFETPQQATGLLRELRRADRAGQEVDYTVLSGADVRDRLPQASDRITTGVRLEGQRFVDPGEFVASLARSVQAREGVIRSGFDVAETSHQRHGVTVQSTSGETVSADVGVLATGAWLGQLARSWGVRKPVQAGRGYSFTVPTDEPVPGPIYLPGVRVACTPYRGGLRVAGSMEFCRPDDALNPERVDAIVASARPLLTGIRWGERTDEWVGPRPVTPDGQPLIGAVATRPGFYLAGGHGMWGLTQGPITGHLLAEEITTGQQSDTLRAFAPMR